MAIEVWGVDLDSQTRCAHYRSELDVIAIKMRCCGRYYACVHCHNELEDHSAQIWPMSQHGEKVVLCGVCRVELSAVEYFASGDRCPVCRAGFNPGCKNHRDQYFEVKCLSESIGDVNGSGARE